MFTGIVQAVGSIVARQPRGGDLELEIEPGALSLAGVRTGDSIAVCGVCLTVTHLGPAGFRADVSRETLEHTTLGEFERGRGVNLELALKAGEPLSGHLVSGHIDGVATLVGRREDGRSTRFEFALPLALARYVAGKGSVCIDGVSLTVNEADATRFGVNLIPHTLAVTTLGQLQPATRVNLEVDLIARYLERLRQFEP